MNEKETPIYRIILQLAQINVMNDFTFRLHIFVSVSSRFVPFHMPSHILMSDLLKYFVRAKFVISKEVRNLLWELIPVEIDQMPT